MSAQFAIAEPRRIKATHRRRRKVTAGHFVQRYYDPAIGRFLSTDPMPTDPNSGTNFNSYWYANNNPYRFTDPDGRVSSDVHHEDRPPRPNDIPKPPPVAQTAKPPVTQAQTQVSKVDVVGVAVGGAEIIVGGDAVVAGLVTFGIAAAAGQEDVAAVAAGVVTVGALGMSDGANRIANAVDGGNRRSTLGEIGETLFGEQAGVAGDAASMYMNVRGAGGASAAIKAGSNAQLGAAVVNGAAATKDLHDASQKR